MKRTSAEALLALFQLLQKAEVARNLGAHVVGMEEIGAVVYGASIRKRQQQ